MKKGWIKNVSLGVVVIGLMASISGCSSITTGSKSSDTVTVLGKNFTEQDIMANLVGLMLKKNTNLDVKVKSYLGGTDVVLNAMKSGSGDVYVEYTGTGLVNILGEKPVSDPDQVYQIVKKEFPQKYQIDWLKPLGFNDTYAMAVTAETAKTYHLKTISDLVKHENELTLGTEQEFIDRNDGLKGLQKTYNLHFKDVKAMDVGLKYQALTSGKVDVIDAFTTDGLLAKDHLVLLQDDKQFFPPYYAVPLVREETLKEHPEIQDVLDKLAGKIDEKQMAELNAEVDIEKKKANDVAQDWLLKEGLIKQ